MNHHHAFLDRSSAASLLLALILFTCAPVANAQGSLPDHGRNLAAACASCHGTNGASAGGLPALAGQPRERLVQALKEFRDGKRNATIMHQISRGYGDEQIELIAAYLAAQKAR